MSANYRRRILEISAPLFYAQFMNRKAISQQKVVHEAFRRISLILLLIVAMNSLESTVFINGANAALTGQKCTKVGLKSGSLVCTNVKGKLIWQIAKKKQSISVQFPLKESLSSKTTSISYSASSRLPVTATSIFPTICTIANKTVSFIRVGYCMIRLTQSGNSQFLSATKRDIKILIISSNQISFSLPSTLLLSTSTYQLAGTSTSGLPLTYESLTPDICSVSATVLTLIKPGVCTIRASQSGSDLYQSATSVDVSITIQGSNQVSFSPVTSLLLSTNAYPLVGTSTSGLPLTYESLTPDICSVSATVLTLIKLGHCTIRASQSGSDLYQSATSVDVSITISASRVTSDQIDVVTGFQVKPIYVVPSDGVDHSYDTNGRIATILDAGNAYVNSQIGLQFPIDKTASGYDIQFMRTKLTTAELESANNLTDSLLAESGAMDRPGANRKDYIFFIDVPILENNAACGIGATPGMSAVVAIGESNGLNGSACTGKSSNVDEYSAITWPHELIHNFGVMHTLDNPCDLMRGAETPGTCPPGAPITMDKEHTRYLGSAAQGQDILKLRVWAGHTDDPNLQADCLINPAVPRSDGFGYAYCPTGTHAIGSLQWCWSNVTSISLEEFVGGIWTSLGTGNQFAQFWGGTENKGKCRLAGYLSPWKQLTVTTPGISLYRWMMNGVDEEQFKVIWVR